MEEEDGSDDDKENNHGNGNKASNVRRKIKIEYISDKSKRHITFSKRKAGIMKKVPTHTHGCLSQRIDI